MTALLDRPVPETPILAFPFRPSKRTQRRRATWVIGAAAALLVSGGALVGLAKGPAARVDWRTTQAQTVLDSRDGALHWTQLSTPTGPVWHLIDPSAGVLDLDVTTHQVRRVVFDRHLTGGVGVPRLSAAEATVVSARFAQRLGIDTAMLTARPVELIDHGMWLETNVTWQARQGIAWLPTIVSVGVNSMTGQVGYIDWAPVQVDIPIAPSVSAHSAQTIAVKVAHLGSNSTASRPELDVVSDSGPPHLVWSVPVRMTGIGTFTGVRQVLVRVDAQTSVATIWATY